MCLHCAPVEERIVVSEMGEQWSPITLPASVAASVTIAIAGFVADATAIPIGTRIPIAPQLAPVVKAKTAAITNIAAGITATGNPPFTIAEAMNLPVPRRSVQTAEIPHNRRDKVDDAAGARDRHRLKALAHDHLRTDVTMPVRRTLHPLHEAEVVPWP